MIAGGNSPDIVGPVGKAGRANFQGAWADITPLAEAAGYDLSQYDPALLEFTSDEGVLVGLPSASVPPSSTTTRNTLMKPNCPIRLTRSASSTMARSGTSIHSGRIRDEADRVARTATMPPARTSTRAMLFSLVSLSSGQTRGVGTLFGGGLPYDEADPTTGHP